MSVQRAEEANMSRLMKLAEKFNCFYLTVPVTPLRQPQNEKCVIFLVQGLRGGECKPFIVEGYQVGLVKKDVMKHLLRYPEVFHVTSDFVELNPAFRDFDERTSKVDQVMKQLRAENVFLTLKGWRNEFYDVRTEFYADSLFKIERSATCLFGIKKYGVDINGYVRHPTRGLCLWLQKRSPTKQTWPGKWDNMVGGGLASGMGILQTAHKEAAEEASIPQELLKNLVSAGCVSFYFECPRGLSADTEFVFDLELPVDFVPQNADGEVEKFELLPVHECIEWMHRPDYKTTSIPVTLDFLIRHGFISPENEPHYTRIIELLHVPLQTIYYNGLVKGENGQAK